MVKIQKIIIGLLISLPCWAQQGLSTKEHQMVLIASYTAQGNLKALKKQLNLSFDGTLTLNEAKEILVHSYAYSGFPRSIRGLQALMEIVEQRQAEGKTIVEGNQASEINSNVSKYLRGKQILDELTQTKSSASPQGYGAFAPIIDTFLKEHLFADIFERDILNYSEREWITLAIIASIGKAEPMFKSHIKIAKNLGASPQAIQEFYTILKKVIPKKNAKALHAIINEIKP